MGIDWGLLNVTVIAGGGNGFLHLMLCGRMACHQDLRMYGTVIMPELAPSVWITDWDVYVLDGKWLLLQRFSFKTFTDAERTSAPVISAVVTNNCAALMRWKFL